MGFFRKKEEKKKFDYSDDTKELFSERDEFFAEQRRKLGGGDTNPELANQETSREERPKEDLGDLLGDSDFNPRLYINSGWLPPERKFPFPPELPRRIRAFTEEIKSLHVCQKSRSNLHRHQLHALNYLRKQNL